MFIITLKQVAILLLYILLGYFLCRKKVIGKETSKILSKLLVYVFSPAYIFGTARWLTASKISVYLVIVCAGVLVLILSVILAHFLAKPFSNSKFERNLYKYIFAFSNFGYFGYPLIEAVFGPEILALFMLFALPVTMAIYSYGYYILTDVDIENKEAPSIKDKLKRVFSIPSIASIVTVVIGLLPITVPEIVFELLEPAKNCYSVSAMILVGVSLSAFSLKELLLSFKPYLLGVVRLIVIPLLLGGVAFALYKWLNFSSVILIFVVAFCSLPVGMNVVIYPESVGMDGSLGAKSCFISYILAIATIPVWFYLLEILI